MARVAKRPPVGPRDAPPLGGENNGEDGVGDGRSSDGSVHSGSPRKLPPNDAIESHQTRATTSANSVGTQTTNSMVARFLTEQDAQRLESDNSLRTPELGSHGEVLAPNRHDLSVDPSTL
ncbi:hypothetical protein PF008_g31081 [Phytophthora fragariae]|uniref:Uncharacterized protein n=1 Tax=Phytophthora fragariae TaxID=53985 RepID=A0A6G0Q3T3_9STRA|nr:hypothetical protein PF008_g31081 [Phytophthora fragariae]